MKKLVKYGVLLLSLVTLIACGKKTSETSSSSHQSDSQTTKDNTEYSTTATSSVSQSSKQEEVHPIGVADIDLEAISQQDLSTLTGIWRNSNGLSIEFKDDGSILYEGQVITTYTFTAADSSPEQIAKLNLHQGVSGVAVYLLPSGFENPNTLTDEERNQYQVGQGGSDFSQPRLLIGQSIPYDISTEYLYRQ